MTKLIVGVIIIICLIGCSGSEITIEPARKLLTDYPNSENIYKAYLILPEPICRTCNDFKDPLILKSLKGENALRLIFVFRKTNLPLLKKYGDISGMDNVIIDNFRKYHLEIQSDSAFSPYIIYLSRNKIRKIEFLNEKNPSAISNLENFLER